MNIYTDGARFDLGKEVLNEIERSMNNDEFNDLHPNIVKVTYIDIGFDGLQGPTQTTGSGNSPERRLRAPYFAIAAVGGLVVIAAAVIWKRRRDADAASVLTGDTSTLPAGAAHAQDTPATGDAKPPGDSVGLESTMDFSTIQEESTLRID